MEQNAVIQALEQERDKLIIKYKLPIVPKIEIRLLKKKYLNGRIVWSYFPWMQRRRKPHVNIKTISSVKIIINLKVLEQFGWRVILQTFLHEMAHLICIAVHGLSGHYKSFKIICRDIGGTMNWNYAKKHGFILCATSSFVRG